ncbi:MAG: Ribosomal-protein-alanine acetyltransferase [uncultured bacterium]|nr:MAG: Ribosomal-protein-alanine acetyltransferase [uncultured bacterium]OFW67974.1 MAG: hypothetical protein A2X70_07570 [Alphaproteobacteria bacterium GWC2_42_16]OFW74676.1 MAG: hypothetical protein A2Z80_00730 [Alphaproteobacteria bacterium GWA2_41_27]OFW84981.1 MAG: hypothetical protein A3E50_03110 [Alphaproteobacteria bacterium RIFCSPHIGHO2_12_FULL_42_100]OFW85552.1 MAG: hypothetical protein A2W06_03030 [Alphaproteobacteria bacterium RBG_16_42_14]OFW91123.1 MAG: hypothetical protein A2W4
MTLSPLTQNDCSRASLLHQEVFFKGWSEIDFLDLLKEPHIHGLKITENGVLTSYILWRVVEDEAEILTLVVTPFFQKKGQGSQLLHELTNHLIQNGVSYLFIEVAEDNMAGRAFYERHSFLFRNKRPKYYRREGNNLVAALNLSKRLL